MKKLLKKWNDLSLIVRILIGLIIGVVLGLTVPGATYTLTDFDATAAGEGDMYDLLLQISAKLKEEGAIVSPVRCKWTVAE